MLTNQAAVARFVAGATGRSGHILAETDGLYSYGHHWPLAVRLPGGKGDRAILCNGDRYHKPTTNHHAGLTFRALPDAPRVSFTAMRAAGIRWEWGNFPQVVDHTRDLHAEAYDPAYLEARKQERPEFDPSHCHQDTPGYSWESFNPPVGSIQGVESTTDGKPYRKWAHRIGSVVLEWAGSHYLCSMDEGTYFIAQLPHRVRTVEGAFKALMPAPVRAAYRLAERWPATCAVRRQGEWFFVPSYRPIRYRPVNSFDLPHEPGRNIHRAGQGANMGPGRLLVAGMVRHLDRYGNPARVSWGRRSPSLHRPLRLPKSQVFRAYRSTAVGSWSGTGQVD